MSLKCESYFYVNDSSVNAINLSQHLTRCFIFSTSFRTEFCVDTIPSIFTLHSDIIFGFWLSLIIISSWARSSHSRFGCIRSLPLGNFVTHIQFLPRDQAWCLDPSLAYAFWIPSFDITLPNRWAACSIPWTSSRPHNVNLTSRLPSLSSPKEAIR